MGRIDMHTLQEFVRLARMGTGFRTVARMLRISPNTEREYRKVFDAEGLLAGDPTDLPEPAVLQAALEKHRPARLAPQQESSVERWAGRPANRVSSSPHWRHMVCTKPRSKSPHPANSSSSRLTNSGSE